MKKSKSVLPIIGNKKEKNKETSPGKNKKSNKKKKSKSKTVKEKKDMEENEETKEMPPLNSKNIDNKDKKIENIIDECGIPMAFNVIFSELISKQIMPENFFTYTSLRLKEIGREIEKLKVKEPVYIERLNEKIPEKRLKTEGDKVIKNDNLFMTEQHPKKSVVKFNG